MSTKQRASCEWQGNLLLIKGKLYFFGKVFCIYVYLYVTVFQLGFMRLIRPLAIRTLRVLMSFAVNSFCSRVLYNLDFVIAYNDKLRKLNQTELNIVRNIVNSTFKIGTMILFKAIAAFSCSKDRFVQ